MQYGPLVVFALGASVPYGTAVARAMGTSLAGLEERTFEDGEHKTRPLAEVAGRDVMVIHSLYGDAQESANDKLVRLLFVLATVRDAGAARVTAVCPYLAYARKDRRTQPSDPVTVRYVAQLFEASGTDCIVTMDVHNQAAFENAFRCRTVHLEAVPLFAAHFRSLLGDGEIVVVSPDAGGMKRAEAFRLRLQTDLGRSVGAAFAEKHRVGGVVSGDALVGHVEGATAVIVDDLVSAGTTIARATAACFNGGATRVLAAATHGVFATESNALLGESPVAAIAVTDTIAPWRVVDRGLAARITVLSSVEFLAESLLCLHEDRALPRN